MRASPLAPALVAALFAAPGGAAGQRVKFESDLPRVVVFLREDGATAATIVTTFLEEAGFDVIDAAFARTAGDVERARRALAGDQAEATALGRDLGAQVIVLGSVAADASPNPADPALQVGTARLDVRALRLDQPGVVATGSTSGRAVEATPVAARAAAIQQATAALLNTTKFLGDVTIDWEEHAWKDAAYWQPEAASVPAALASEAGPLALAILEADAYAGGTRSILVSAAPKTGAETGGPAAPPPAGAKRARVRGIVTDPRASVQVGGVPAHLRPLTGEERTRYGIPGAVAIFEAELVLPPGQDTVRVRAEAAAGSAETLVRTTPGRIWAVVIGVSHYVDSRITPLRYADADARAVHAFLRSAAGGAVPESQIRLLLNEQATAARIRQALFVFLQQASAEDLAIVYVASHGAPDPRRPANLYIIPHDADLDALAATAFPMWDFKTAVRRQIAAERVVVLADACHAGGATGREAGSPMGPAFGELFSPSRRVTLTAAGADELSREGPQWGRGHGVFTHALLEGLGGLADADRDGIVSFSEAAAFVQARVARDTGGQQNPERAGFGDVPLARHRPAAP